jgi:putative SOS response-associated peptidase YedK
MCGRFVSSSPPDEVARYFDVDRTAEQVLDHRPNFNTAPTTDVLVVVEDGGARSLDAYHWGLVPSWAKDLSVGNRMINARAETLATKPAYRRAFAGRRCIVPADGFYEWRAIEGAKRKQPFFIHRPDGEPYAFAALWEQWRGTLGTTGPAVPADADDGGRDTGEEVTVILPPEAWAEWLDPTLHDTDRLGRLLVPAPDAVIAMHPVSTEVNSVRNKGPHLVDEIDPETGEPVGDATPPPGRLL